MSTAFPRLWISTAPALPYTPAVIGRWVSHALIYLSACSTISMVWVLLTTGTVDDLEDYARRPVDAFTLSFWPIWFWLLWGSAVAMHLAVVIGRALPGRGRGRHGMARSGRRHIVAMFTDLSGSTAANEKMGDVAWAALVADHRKTVRELMAQFGGTEVNTQGDGFFLRFHEPSAALACAGALQERCKAERAAGSPLPPVRIGIHQGEAVHEDDDVLGQVVNVAARLLDVARPHEILVTEPVADGADADLLVDRGLISLKGFSQARHLLSVRWDPEGPGESGPTRIVGRRSRPRAGGRRWARSTWQWTCAPAAAVCRATTAVGPCISGARPAATAEALMRSRYTASVSGDADYLLYSWAPEHRPARLPLDVGRQWTMLEILDTDDGRELSSTGIVEFRAHYVDADRIGVLHERSRFGRHAGRWVYIDGLVVP